MRKAIAVGAILAAAALTACAQILMATSGRVPVGAEKGSTESISSRRRVNASVRSCYLKLLATSVSEAQSAIDFS